VIIAVIAMREVQTAIDKVANMIAVRDGFMATAGAVNVTFFVTLAPVFWCAPYGVRVADLDDVLIDVIFVHVVKVAVMQIVHMSVVPDGDMATPRPVLMVVSRVMGVGTFRHGYLRVSAPGDYRLPAILGQIRTPATGVRKTLRA